MHQPLTPLRDAIDLLAIRLEDLDALAEGDALSARPNPEAC